jgi:hypothetical protein
LHTGFMENNQEFDTQKFNNREFDIVSADVTFEVTYLDTDSGRIRTEFFDDAADAERFASRRVADEDGWAIIDAVPPQQARAAA